MLIALALVFFVMRPLLKKVLTPEQPLALPASAEVGGPGLNAIAPERFPEDGESEDSDENHVPAWMDHAKSMGEAQAQTLKTVGQLVVDNPKQAAVIVRDWLSSAA